MFFSHSKWPLAVMGLLLVSPLAVQAESSLPVLSKTQRILDDKETLSSKDMSVSLFMNNEGALACNVSYKGFPVVEGVSLGMDIDHSDIGLVAEILEKKKIDSGFEWKLKSQGGMVYYLEMKVFPDGWAVRYRIPSERPMAIYRDNTSYTFPKGTRAWYASGPFQYGWLQEYQDRDLEDIKDELLAPPTTFRLPNGYYVALTEANLFDFHGAVLMGRAPRQISWSFVGNIGHKETGIQTGLPPSKYWHGVVRDEPWFAEPKTGTAEIITPWRVMMVSSDLTGLVNNKILENVCDSPNKELFPQGAKTDWVKPGRSVFTWLADGGGYRLSLECYRKFIDGAGELGLESVVVDDGWELWQNTEKEANGRDKWTILKELVDYAKERKVDIWVWRSSSPRSGNTSDIGMVDASERDSFMKKCVELGVKGLKIDFFHTENLFTVRLMEAIMKDAARHKLMVIYHGVNKPTGDDVTYPNLLAKEAVRGLECVGGESSWAPGPPWPYHNTVLPFTRWLVGGGDYTPLNFRSFCHPSVTFGHQFASIYVLTSKMLIFAADMEDMLKTPGRSFIESVPSEWDETLVLEPSAIGQLALMARRKGDVWYLCALNGEKVVDPEVALSFLPQGDHVMEIVEDKGENRKEIQVRKEEVKSGQKMKFSLMSGGGFVARFTKK